jgi:hypothetical protein
MLLGCYHFELAQLHNVQIASVKCSNFEREALPTSLSLPDIEDGY